MITGLLLVLLILNVFLISIRQGFKEKEFIGKIKWTVPRCIVLVPNIFLKNIDLSYKTYITLSLLLALYLLGWIAYIFSIFTL